jgi:two-component system NtrC family sensor kinase
MRQSRGTGQPTTPPRQKRGPSKSHRTATAAARDRGPSVAELQDELNALRRELSEAREQQTATADVLKVISQSTFKLQPIFDTIVKTASRLCNAETALIFMFREEKLHLVATNNASSAFVQHALEHPLPPGRSSITGRTFLERQTVHLPDCLADPEYALRDFQAIGKHRSMLGVPLLREGSPIGVITLWRTVVLPFADTEIDLVKTFADQAVIAIENVRLFEAERQRTRELTESLQQQTATANVLKVISRATFDLPTVLKALLRSAGSLCEADMGAVLRPQNERFIFAASFGLPQAHVDLVKDLPIEAGRESLSGRVMTERRPVHIPDVLADPEYSLSEAQKAAGYRSMLGVPLLRDSIAMGIILLMRSHARPFTDKQIDLAQTFADQAVIAIENVRLFEAEQERTRELTESLQQQTATADVLKAISRSTFDLQTVLDTLVESATRLCNADYTWLFQREGEDFRWVASFGLATDVHARIRDFLTTTPVQVNRGSITGRVALEGRAIHIPDVLADPEYTYSVAQNTQKIGRYRAALGVPLLRQGEVVGVLCIMKTVPQPFTAKQIELATTFADQAVIAAAADRDRGRT